MPPGQNAPADIVTGEPVEQGVPVRTKPGLAIGLALIILLVYLRASGFDFVGYDDHTSVYTNPYLNPVSWNSLYYFWRHSYLAVYMPVTDTLWLALARVAGLAHPIVDPNIGSYSLNPHIFHTANLCFHIVAVLLVYALLRCFVKRDWAAAAGALLFGIHPVQAESVAWISALCNPLSSVFALVALYYYTLFARGEKEGRPLVRRRRHYAWATLAFALALLARPSAVMVPFMAWALDRWMVGRGARACTRPLLVWLGLAALCAVATQGVQARHVLVWTPLQARPLVAGDALDFYLFKMFVPWHLCPHYGRTPDWLLAQRWHFLTIIPPLLLGAAIWKLRKQYPCLLVAACLFVLGVLPVLGLVPHHFQINSTVADRYLYPAMLGPALLLACLLERPRPLADASAAIVLMVLAGLCWRQVGYWRDTRTLFEHTLTVNPDSWMAYAVLAEGLNRQGHPDAAIADFRRSLRLHPNQTIAENNLGLIYLSRSQIDAAQACFKAVVAIDPWDELGRVNLAKIYFDKGQNRQAIETYQAVLRDFPESEAANYGLAAVFLKQAEPGEAARCLTRVLDKDPSYALVHIDLANLLDELGQTDAARSHFLQALALTPDSPEANTGYGMYLMNHKQAVLAVPFLVEAVRLAPRDAQARNNLGLALFQQKRYSESAGQFLAAVSLNPRFAVAHYDLGMAQMKLGLPAQAVAEWRHALAIDGSFAPARHALTWSSKHPNPEYRLPPTFKP